MRLLLPAGGDLTPAADLDLADLAAVYAAPSDPWLRCNMVTTVDGGATGPDGRSGSINTAADHIVFELLRGLSHAVIVGAGTIRAEGYTGLTVSPDVLPLRRDLGIDEPLPLIAVSRSGRLPESAQGAAGGPALLATCARAPGLAEAQSILGREHVLVCGEDEVDLPLLVARLHERGWTRLLCEGGPHLTGSFLAVRLVDELCFTIAPRVVGGMHPRPVGPAASPLELELGSLVEADGTLMGRWFTPRRPSGSGD
ncbi:dihydrofolate reductase family protein [Intrasporangium calvum]|uniref:Bifunctional deaminase-reductase domain protein n=1 Tax=Intrasporangium calvum (strain ATCC 23552 / DSM 43043 / JCM 3097 / NBRC 12989 / NCIMB 10167 / NRRL B-3866 / 7 KIP) TaxID=710696 RepID=E6SBC6_INTC7|nr:dihydrofolate reductase family protein [Intrasporangium calvum]ADU48414.1 bifunctional deaminase-reductase domain protein [Intrasporangium calvum DSM 43043]